MSDPSAGSSGRSPSAETPADFEREALPHIEAVYRFALRLTGSPDAAEDLVQETFFRAFRAWEQYTPGTSCKSWLFTICRNVFLRGAERARKHDDIVTREAGPDPGAISRAVPVWTREFGKDPEAGFFDSFVDREILEAIDSLPEDYREAVVLSDMEGLGYREIADMVGAPIGTVKSRLFRGRRMLQDKLFEYAVGMGYVRPPREESGG